MITIDSYPYSSIIFEILNSQKDKLSGSEKRGLTSQLQEKAWIQVNDDVFTPSQVLEIKSAPLRKYLLKLVEISAGRFINATELKENERALLSHYRLLTELEASDVIKHVLESEEPHLNAGIVCDALKVIEDSKGGKEIDEYTFELLREVAWVPCQELELSKETSSIPTSEIAVSPADIIEFSDIANLEKILSQSRNNRYIAISQVVNDVYREDGFKWLRDQGGFFLQGDSALRIIGDLVSELPDYWIANLQDYDFKVLWDVLRSTPFSASPGWGLANNLNQSKFKAFVFDKIRQTPKNSSWAVFLLNQISNSNPEPDGKATTVYNYYLEIACGYKDFAENILSNIQLLNQSDEWKSPATLCWEKELEGVVNGTFILNKEQRDILSEYLDSLVKPSRVVGQENDEDYICGNTFDVLKGYFQPWESRIRSQFLGAFLSLLAKDEPNLEKLAQGYLNRNIDSFRSRLLRNLATKKASLKPVQIILGQSQSTHRPAFSVTGRWIKVSKTGNRSSDLIEDINIDVEPAEVHLIQFSLDSFSGSLEDTLYQATRKIISSLYGIPVIPKEFDLVWNELRSRQLDIQVAHNYVLSGAPYVLRELGLTKTSESLSGILLRWDKKRRDQAELVAQDLPLEESLGKESLINLEIRKIIEEIACLFEGETPECESIRDLSLRSVRKKMRDFGYEAVSIPFEIFQNADDAIVESDKILPDSSSDENRQKFIIEWNDNHITFMHWGRPINLCWTSDDIYREHKHEGFDRDLEKMVVLNISDKSAGTTGKFGLGFKSVHLFTNNCQVISADLAFTVIGGLLPAKLKLDISEENGTKIVQSSLRAKLKKYSQLSDGTIMHLRADPELQALASANPDLKVSAKAIIESFQKFVPLLLIFSKRIRYCTTVLYGNQRETLSWQPRQVLNLSGVDYGEVELQNSLAAIDVNRHQLLCLHPQGLPSEIEGATLLLGFISRNSKPEASFSKEVPTFWVTAPTQEKLGLGFVINANFDITTGRESLVKGSSLNRELAEIFGEGLGLLLANLFYKSAQNWEDFTSDLGMNFLKQYDFWHFIWDELVSKWQKLDDSPVDESILELIRLILGGERGMGYLVTHAPALPTGLWGNYQQLIPLNQAEYSVEGVLATESYFPKVAQWPKFAARYQNNLVASKVKLELQDLLGKKLKLKSLELIDVLRLEVSGPSQDVTHEQAQRLGHLIDKLSLEKISDANESKKIQEFLNNISFKAKDGEFYLADSLLLTIGDMQKEERLLAGFAPQSRLLHPDYIGNALSFFMACRSKRDKVDLDTKVDWVLEAEESQYEAVLEYLLAGDDRDELAGKLVDKEGWFSDRPEFRRLIQHAEDRADIKAREFEETERTGSTSETETEVMGPQPDGDGNPQWGIPGEMLAKLFYNEKLGYEIRKSETDAVDFECVKGHERLEIEVKTISSRAIRLPIYEWERMVSKGESYELLIVHHNGKGAVSQLFRVRNAWGTIAESLEKLNFSSLTTAQEDTDPNVESLLGLQQDKDRNGKLINVVILNWVKLVDEFANNNSFTGAIEVHPCSAKLVNGQDSVVDLQWL